MSTRKLTQRSERALQQNRKVRRDFELLYVPALKAEGYRVLRLSEFHYRINDRVDVYPTSKRYVIRLKRKVNCRGLYRWLGHLKGILKVALSACSTSEDALLKKTISQ